MAELDATGIALDGYFVHGSAGGDLNLNNFRNRTLRPAMLDVAESVEGFTPWTLKDLRHTFSTELLAAGVPITHVAHWMGDAVRIEDDHGRPRRVRTKAIQIYDHPSDRHVAYAVSVMADYVGAGELRLFNPGGSQLKQAAAGPAIRCIGGVGAPSSVVARADLDPAERSGERRSLGAARE